MSCHQTMLVIIDVQKAIDDPKWGARNNAEAEDRMAELLEFWRADGKPIVHIRHDSTESTSPYKPGFPRHEFKPEVMPLVEEKVIGKSTNNAFVGTGLESYLSKLDIKNLIICGVLTQHSVDCTARMAASLGFEVTVVSDATAATEMVDLTGKRHSAEDVHQLTLAHLAEDYAKIKTTSELLVKCA